MKRDADGWGVDAYTHLGINAENEWGLKASLFASKDVLEDNRK